MLYLVNASEDPEQAGYVAPELELLGWIGRPVLAAPQPDRPAARRRRPRARHRAVAGAGASATRSSRDVLPLDAFTRCWVQEGLLWERVRDALPADRRAAPRRVDRALARRAGRDLPRDRPTRSRRCSRVAANDVEPIRAGGRRELRRAADALGRRLREAVGAANERLIALHGLDGEAAEALRIELGDVTAPGAARAELAAHRLGRPRGRRARAASPPTSRRAGSRSAAARSSGRSSAPRAGAGSRSEWSCCASDEAPRAAWSRPFAERLATDAVLRYLAVAHFGRGAGSFRVRDHPETFRAAAERAVANRHEGLRGASGAEIVPTLERALREALAQLHPEGAHLLPAPRERA